MVTGTGSLSNKEGSCPITLNVAFLKHLRNVQGTSKAKCKEIFLRDLRKAMQRHKGVQLKEVIFIFIYLKNLFQSQLFYLYPICITINIIVGPY